MYLPTPGIKWCIGPIIGRDVNPGIDSKGCMLLLLDVEDDLKQYYSHKLHNLVVKNDAIWIPTTSFGKVDK